MKGTQMYEIYINETKVLLKPSADLTGKEQSDSKNLVIRYYGKPAHILGFVDMFEKTKRIKSLILHHSDFKKLKTDFLSLFTVVKACGGLVLGDEGKYLFIYRRGSWDLPKGKMESGETKKQTAVREVEEETAVKIDELTGKLCKTNHTYKCRSGRRCIKKSYWYLMRAKQNTLKPQREEDIEKAEWLTLEEFKKKKKVYRSIRKVIEVYEQKYLK